MPRIDHDAAVAYVLSLIDDWSERGKAKERELNCLRYVASMTDAAKRLEEALRNLLPVADETCKRWPNDDCFLIPTANARAVLASLPRKEER